MATVLSLFRPPPADQPVSKWHVAPGIDVFAYAFSWLPLLLPIFFLGDRHQVDYLVFYLIVLGITDVHRHYGLPYVYLDKQVFERHPVRFTAFPALLFLGFLGAPFLVRGFWMSHVGLLALLAGLTVFVQVLRRDRDELRPDAAAATRVFGPPAVALAVLASVPFGPFAAVDRNFYWLAAAVITSFGFEVIARRKAAEQEAAGVDAATPRFVFPAIVTATAAYAVVAQPEGWLRAEILVNTIGAFAGLWNIWHVYMQKYGILRMYNAKSGDAEKVPGWVDRLLIFAWLPLYLSYLAAEYGDEVHVHFPQGRATFQPIFEALVAAEAYLIAPSAALVVFSLSAFVYWEKRVNGLKNAPRLWMAVGTTLLAATFFFVHPLKAYLAYAFSHSVEYLVFVWGFQRRRYAAPLAHQPFIERFLRFPFTTYVLSALALAAFFTYFKYYGRYIWTDQDRPMAFGFQTQEWILYWTIFQSMVHFYFDGFLWKMRLKTVRATI